MPQKIFFLNLLKYMTFPSTTNILHVILHYCDEFYFPVGQEIISCKPHISINVGICMRLLLHSSVPTRFILVHKYPGLLLQWLTTHFSFRFGLDDFFTPQEVSYLIYRSGCPFTDSHTTRSIIQNSMYPPLFSFRL